jgi:hypothetical protein
VRLCCTAVRYSNHRDRIRPTPPASERLISRAGLSDPPARSSHRAARTSTDGLTRSLRLRRPRGKVQLSAEHSTLATTAFT